MIRVAIVDDHDLVRAGIRAILEQDPLYQIVGETGDGQDAIRMATAVKPDIMLMDIHLPGSLGGLEATEAIVKDAPEVKVIILTQYENREYIRRAIRIGARGYLLKSSLAPQLKEAIRVVQAGQRYLHPSVADELVDLVTAGRSIQDVEDDYERRRRERGVRCRRARPAGNLEC
jgi:DNA-binding NarL/FixJ family response regulator